MKLQIWFFSFKDPGNLVRIHHIMKLQEILNGNLAASAKMLQLGCGWTFQQDNDQKWFNDHRIKWNVVIPDSDLKILILASFCLGRPWRSTWSVFCWVAASTVTIPKLSWKSVGCAEEESPKERMVDSGDILYFEVLTDSVLCILIKHFKTQCCCVGKVIFGLFLFIF